MGTSENRLLRQQTLNVSLQEQAVNHKRYIELLQSELADSNKSNNELRWRMIEKDAQLASSLKRNVDLEQQLSFMTQKCADAGNIRKLSEKISDKDKDLMEIMKGVTDDMKCKDLEEKLKFTEEQLELERKSVEQFIARYLELEILHDFLVKEFKQKLEIATTRIFEKDSEVEQLYIKLNSLEEQSALYQEQVIETTEKLVSLKMDLEASAARLASRERTVEELTEKLSNSEAKALNSVLEQKEEGSAIRENSGIKSKNFFSGVVAMSLIIGVFLMKKMNHR